MAAMIILMTQKSNTETYTPIPITTNHTIIVNNVVNIFTHSPLSTMDLAGLEPATERL